MVECHNIHLLLEPQALPSILKQSRPSTDFRPSLFAWLVAIPILAGTNLDLLSSIGWRTHPVKCRAPVIVISGRGRHEAVLRPMLSLLVRNN